MSTRCDYCLRAPCLCRRIDDHRELRSYFSKAETWEWVRTRFECPVDGCHLHSSVENRLCPYHEWLLPMSIVVQGLPADVIDVQGDLFEVESDPLHRRAMLAKECEELHDNRA